VRNLQLRKLLVRAFVYEFLRQSWSGPLEAIKAIADGCAEFREMLNEEMFHFGAMRRKHPFFDQDLEQFEVRGVLGPVMLRKYKLLRVADGKVGVVKDGMPGRRRSRRIRVGELRLKRKSSLSV